MTFYWAALILYTLLIGRYLYLWSNLKVETQTERTHSVGVLIVARNEEEYIDTLLSQVTTQSIKPVEIVVVDDQSTDRTAEIIKSYDSVTYLLNNPSTSSRKKEAIQMALQHMKADIVMQTDADCELGEHWVAQTLNSFQDKTHMVLGPVSYFGYPGVKNKLMQLEMSALSALSGMSLAAKHPYLANGANMAYRRDSFLEVNGLRNKMDTASGDDIHLLESIKTRFSIDAVAYSKRVECIVRTAAPRSNKEFINQRIRWASKNSFTKLNAGTLVQVLMLIVNLALILPILNSLGFQIVDPVHSPALYGGLFLKLIVDSLFYSEVLKFFGRKKLIIYFPVLFLIYPFYILVIGILSKIKSFEWKGIQIND